jgi:hypothetical protein
MKNNDGDSLHCHLRPVEQAIVSYAMAHLHECFCWLEFASKYNNNTIRNAFSHLVKLKLLDRCCRSSNAYYILHKSERISDEQKVTITHMAGRHNRKFMQLSYLSYIESFGWEEIWRVHDVCLCFRVEGLYKKMWVKGMPINRQSKDIKFLDVEIPGNLRITVFLHRTGMVTCYVKCSLHPIEVTPEGLVDFTAILGKIAAVLEASAESSSFMFKLSVVPNVSNWIVMQWHFGRDGKKEISGKSYHVTYRNWSGALIRVYLKKNGDKFRARKEVIEQPRKPLPNAFAEKMVTDDSISHKDFQVTL